MKRSLLLLVFSVFALPAFAQITLTSDDFFNAFAGQDNSTSYSSDDTLPANALIATQGANKTWDFSSFTYTQDSASGDKSTILTYPGGAPLADDPDFLAATHVLKVVSSTPGDPIVYEFIKINSSGFWILGESQDSAGVGSKVASYVPPLQEFAFPCTYQTSWSSTSEFHSPSIPSGFTYTTTLESNVDSYGSLVTPSRAHKGESAPMASNECLRIKTKNTSTVALVPLFSQTSVSYEFQFLTKGAYSATISADTNERATSVGYSKQGTSGVTPEAAIDDMMNLRLSSNPASNTETHLNFRMSEAGNAQVVLMDPLGKDVLMLHNGFAPTGDNMIPIDPSKLTAGSYFIRATANGVTSTRKLIITH
jgi:hypothetical protein